MPKRGRKTDSDRLAAKKIENDILQGLCVRSVSKPSELADQARLNTQCIKDVEMLEQNLFNELVKHPELTYWLEKATKNTYDPAAAARRDGRDPVQAVLKYQLKKRVQQNMVVAMLMRQKSQDCKPLPIVVLSLQAFRTGLNRELWANLTRAGVLLSKTTTEAMMRDFSSPVPSLPKTSAEIGLAVYDNCGYYQKRGYDAADSGSTMIQTVNWFHTEVDQNLTSGGDFSHCFKQMPNMRHLFDPDPQVHQNLLDFCAEFVLECNGPFEYPSDSVQPTQAAWVVHSPILDTNTASYYDNAKMLEQILDDMRTRYPNLTYIFVAGDEQTYDRMIKLKSDDLDGYDWLIPLPGDFHVAGHILMGIFRLYWSSVLSFFLIPLQRDKVTQDFLMSKFNRHEEFFLHVVLGVMKWFRHCFGASCLEYPADLKDQCKDNYTSTVLWHFLFEYAFPYVAFRMTLRLSPTPERRRRLQQFYPYWCGRVRAVNKYLYSMLFIHAVYVYEKLTDDLQSVLDYSYTLSMKGW